MTIRAIREPELPVLVDDLWFPFAEEMGELDPYNELAENVRNDAIEHRERQFEDDDVAIFLSESDDASGHGERTITGYAVVTASESPPIFARGREASLGELYVRPRYRDQGLGTRLMQRAESWAGDEDCEYIELGVNADNDPARALYESQGYSVRRQKMDKRLNE